MNYDTILLEMLSRIQSLEERVNQLEGGKSVSRRGGKANKAAKAAKAVKAAEGSAKQAGKVSTGDIRDYIREQKRQCAQAGGTELVLKAGEIHKTLKLKNRLPMVCNAMRQCMEEGDAVLHETASGYSSTLEIRYAAQA